MTSSSQLRLVFWESTAACNLECIHCRRLEVSQELSREDLSTEEARTLIKGIRLVGQPIFILSGGEPLMRPDILDLASFARDQELLVALATNGTLIDESLAKRIGESGIRRVSVSLDGSTPQSHDTFRKLSGSFEAALRGLDFLKKVNMSLQINVTVARHNVHELEDIYRLALEMKVDALHFFMLVPVGCGVEIAEDQMLPARQYEQTLQWIYERTQEERLQIKATCAPHYMRVARQQKKKGKLTPQGDNPRMAAMTKGCLAGTGVCFISHRGEVFPCGYFPVEAGNIRKVPFPQVWQSSPLFQELRDPSLLKGKCGECEFKKVCGGCRARAYGSCGDYLEEEPFCLYQPRKSSLQKKSGR